MNIRKATIQDIPLIRRISNETWPVTYGEILSQEQIAYMLDMMYSETALHQQLSHPDQEFFIAEENGTAYGFMGIQWNYPATGTTKLHKIYVLPSAQGKQVGKRLIQYIIGLLDSKNQSIIALNVNRNNKARSFYEHLGFTITGEEDIDIGNGYLMEDYIMECRINA